MEKHRSNLMRKLDLHSVASLTAFPLKKGSLNLLPTEGKPEVVNAAEIGPSHLVCSLFRKLGCLPH